MRGSRVGAVLLALALLALVLVGAARLVQGRHAAEELPASRAPAAPSASSPDHGLPVGTSVEHVPTAAGDRTYRLHVPATLPSPAPLVLVLHGGFGSGAQAQRSYGWDAVADREGFVVAYPDGLARAWNSGGGCCGTSARDGVDDVAFLTAVVADVSAGTPVDPARVFAAGMSNGAMMAQRLACETDVLAAVGAVAGTIAPEAPCAPPGRPSVVLVNGTTDTRVLYDGGTSRVGTATVHATAAPQVAQLWRDLDRCGAPTTTAEGPVVTSTATCPAGRSVSLVTIEGYGHEWPSPNGSQTPYGETVYTGWDATAQLWAFFAAHPRIAG